MVTNMQADKWLTCLAQPLTLWIINLPLGLTCGYGRQRLASPAQVVTTPFPEMKLSGSHAVKPCACVNLIALFFFFFFSQKTHSFQRDAGRVRGRYMPGEWVSERVRCCFNCILLSSIWNWCLWHCQCQLMHKPLGLSHRLICHCPQPELATTTSNREVVVAETCSQFVPCYLWSVSVWPAILCFHEWFLITEMLSC